MAFNLKNKLEVWGQRVAENEYLKRGFVLVARNIHKTRGKMLGEIDLVVRSDRSLVFVEIEVRKGDRFGSAAQSVAKVKQRKLIIIVRWFSRRFPQYNNLQPRIDFCAIDAAQSVPGSNANLDKRAVNVIIIPSAVTLDN